MSYFVVGGVYKDTSFEELENSENQEKLGPFESYDEALKVWEKVSWEKVDDCNVRYFILPQK